MIKRIISKTHNGDVFRFSFAIVKEVNNLVEKYSSPNTESSLTLLLILLKYLVFLVK